MREIIRKSLITIMGFVVPFIISLAAFAALKITPFGTKTLIFGDSNGYYINYLRYFETVMSGEHSIFYSFSKGMGGNIYALVVFYIFRPETWLYLLAGWDYLPQMFSINIILTTSMSGLTMGLLLSDVFGKKASNLIFSTAYALMGFLVVNNYIIPFAYGPMLLPLVILGLLKIRRNEAPIIYILSSTYAIITHIQMGFVLCTASVLFFAVIFLVEDNKSKEENKRFAARYMIASIISGALASFAWIPVILSTRGGRAEQNGIEDYVFSANAPLLQMGARLFSGASSPSQLINGLPAIFCGILVLALVILYFMNTEISRRERTVAGALLFIYITSFYIKTFTTVFQGFTHANWFNFRQSFVFSFVLILIAAREFEYIDFISVRDGRRCVLILVVLSLLIFSQSYEFIDGSHMVMDLAILAIMAWGLWFYRTKPERADKKSLVILCLFCTCLQCYLNYYFSMTQVFDGWKDNIKTVQDIRGDIFKRQPIISGIVSSDTDFFRIEQENPRAELVGNDPLMFDYNGVGHTSIIRKNSLLQNTQKLGVSFRGGQTNFYDKGTPAAMDSLLGIRYVLSENDLTAEKGYDKRIELFGTGAYQNPYALPIAILSDEEVAGVSLEDEQDIFRLQNQIWKGMTGKDENLFIKEEDYSLAIHNSTEDIMLTASDAEEWPDPSATDDESASDGDISNLSEQTSDTGDGEKDGMSEDVYKSYIEISFTAKRSGPVYFYDSSAIIEGYGTDEDVLQYMGTYREGESVAGRIYLNYTIDKRVLITTARGLYIYYADMERLQEYSKLLQNRDITIEKVSDTHLVGRTEAAMGQRLLLTIPYDSGWTLYIDGVKTHIDKTLDLFMSASLTAGEHYYELKYVPPGFKIGALISLVALMALVIMSFVLVIRARRRPSLTD